MSSEELEQFLRAYKSTIYRSRNAYAKKLVLGEPVKVLFRDRSLDDFIELGVKIRKDLKLLLCKNSFTEAEKDELYRRLTAIEENLNQIVKRCTQK